MSPNKTPARGPRIRVSKSLEMQKKLPRTYFVQKANGWRLVKAAMDKRGWQQLPFEHNFSNRFGLKWVERRGHIDYKAHTPGQLVCHIPNNDVICTKSGLMTAFRGYFKVSFYTYTHSSTLFCHYANPVHFTAKLRLSLDDAHL